MKVQEKYWIRKYGEKKKKYQVKYISGKVYGKWNIKVVYMVKRKWNISDARN